MVNIFEHLDYREYLKAYFDDRKQTDPKFSHRWICRGLGLSTTNFILLVMQGKRTINLRMCFRLSELFKHSFSEAMYFETMVNFTQAKNPKEKDTYFSRMMAMRRRLKVNTIEAWQYEYYTNWYNPVVRELVVDPTFKGDPALLAKAILPPIKPSDAKRSIEVLLQLKFIKKQGSYYIQDSPVIATGTEVNSIAVNHFHKAMGQLALESMDRFAKHERNVTSVTLRVPKNTFKIIKQKIEDFRKELLALPACCEEDGYRVYQINFQGFPVSREQEKVEKKEKDK